MPGVFVLCLFLAKMEDERLIIAVRSRELIYNKSDKNHSNRDLIQRAWENIAAEMGNEGDLSLSISYSFSTFLCPFSLSFSLSLSLSLSFSFSRTLTTFSYPPLPPPPPSPPSFSSSSEKIWDRSRLNRLITQFCLAYI